MGPEFDTKGVRGSLHGRRGSTRLTPRAPAWHDPSMFFGKTTTITTTTALRGAWR